MKNGVGRLAMRVEGDWWVAYIAKLDTMDRALEIGRVHMCAASLPGQKDAVLECFKGAFNAMMKDATGATLEWPTAPQPAPEHEKAGRA